MQIPIHQVLELKVPNSTTQVTVAGNQDSWAIPSFIKADGQHYVRLSLHTVGNYQVTGKQFKTDVTATKATTDTALTTHGPITYAPNDRYLMHSDGTPFFWLADTWWYGLSDRASWPKNFKAVVADRIKKHFSVVQVVVGVPPEIGFNSQPATCNGQLPWTADHQPNPAYFDAIDTRIAHLIEAGLLPCLVAGWGPQINTTGEAAMTTWWQTMIARYAAYPVVWCLTGEVDLPPAATAAQSFTATSPWKKLKSLVPSPLVRALKFGQRSLSAPQQNHQLTAWAHIAEKIIHHDPYHRPLLVHPHSPNLASNLLHHPKWLKIDSIQSGHDEHKDQFLVTQALAASKERIFINLEPWYEGILGKFGAWHQRYAFWMSVLAGAKGHSYGADGVWNMRHNDHFLDHWGDQDWETALQLPGGAELGAAKTWLEKFEWWQLQPELSAITPHWESNATLKPLAAQVNKTTYIVYFPELQNNQKFYWQVAGTWQGTWHSPDTLEPATSQTITQGEVVSLPNVKTRDALLVLNITPDLQ